MNGAVSSSSPFGSKWLLAVKLLFFKLFCAGSPERYYFWKAHAFRLLGVLGLYERRHFTFLHSFLREGMTALDVGAHFGVYTRLFLRHVGHTGRVAAFEPFPPAAAYLRKEFATSSQLEVYQIALADCNGEGASLNVPLLADTVPEPALAALTPFSGGEVFLTEIRTLDSMSGSFRRIDVIKLDIEGSELRFFDGARDTIARFRPLIFFEDHELPSRIEYYRRFERELNYVLCRLDRRGELTPYNEESPSAEINYYLCPRELRIFEDAAN